MKKIKKTFWYLLGSFMAFAFTQMGVSAQMQTKYGIEPLTAPAYGIDSMAEPSMWDRILPVILSPIVIAIVIVLAFVFGGIVFLKRKKNAKKDS